MRGDRRPADTAFRTRPHGYEHRRVDGNPSYRRVRVARDCGIASRSLDRRPHHRPRGATPFGGYFDVSFSLAADPTSGDLYVYDRQFNSLSGVAAAGAPPAKISEFAADANGDVSPLRVLSGPNVNLPNDAFSVDILGIDDAGLLYTIAPGNIVSVSVFSSGQHDNAAPRQTFSDPTATVGVSGAAIAIRSSIVGP